MYKVLPEVLELFYSGSYIHLVLNFGSNRVSFRGAKREHGDDAAANLEGGGGVGE